MPPPPSPRTFREVPDLLAAALLGLSNVMLKLVDDPPFVRALMDRCLDYSLAYARALGQWGPDLLSGSDSPAGLLGPQLYGSVALGYEQRLLAAIHAATGKPVALHICGNSTSLLPLMKTSGADVLELDHAVDLAVARRTVGPDIVLWGNLDPVAVLSQGTPALVEQETRKLLASVKASGCHRFVLSSGCTLAMETPSSNLDALIQISPQTSTY